MRRLLFILRSFYGKVIQLTIFWRKRDRISLCEHKEPVWLRIIFHIFFYFI